VFFRRILYDKANRSITLVLNIWRTYIGYVYHLTTPKGGPLAFVATLRTWHQIMKDVIYVIVSLIGDGIAVRAQLFLNLPVSDWKRHLQVYRCWVVWQYNYYVIILPTLLFLGSISESVGLRSHVKYSEPFLTDRQFPGSLSTASSPKNPSGQASSRRRW
jgi:hypothetical protein